MSILQNAIDSVQVGAEDFFSGEKKRFSSSIRNIYAGLLLLYKEKLCELSPEYDKELLIRQKLLPYFENNEMKFKGQSIKVKKTVTVNEILERFESLKIKIDNKSLEKIGNLRNSIEHYYSSEKIETFVEVIAICFLMIKDFLKIHLNKDPLLTLGIKCWNILINAELFYESLKKECLESYKNVSWKYSLVKDFLDSLTCPICDSSLVKATNNFQSYPNVGLSCLACSHNFDFADVLEECLNAHMSILEHINYLDGGDPLIYVCPNCDVSAFINEEEECAMCCQKLEYVACGVCDEGLLGPDDQEYGGLCSYHAYQINKND